MVTDCGIYPNQVLTQIKIQPKLQKRERRLCDVKFKKYNTKTYIKKKKTVNLNQSCKKEQKSTKREREREHSQFFRRKNMD